MWYLLAVGRPYYPISADIEFTFVRSSFGKILRKITLHTSLFDSVYPMEDFFIRYTDDGMYKKPWFFRIAPNTFAQVVRRAVLGAWVIKRYENNPRERELILSSHFCMDAVLYSYGPDELSDTVKDPAFLAAFEKHVDAEFNNCVEVRYHELLLARRAESSFTANLGSLK